MIVALDGPAGCGKSTIARMISESLGFLYINSGNVYRAIAYASLQHSISMDDTKGIISLCLNLDIQYRDDGTIALNDIVLASELRTSDVDAIVAQISAIPEIRSVVNEIVIKTAIGRDSIVEGRDMTTVVFPQADLKFFIDASVEERAYRRHLEKGPNSDYAKILDNIKTRDEIDRNKKIGALKIAPAAVYIDTSGLTIDEVYEKVYSKILHLRDTHGE
jgi:cytidylate kinase